MLPATVEWVTVDGYLHDHTLEAACEAQQMHDWGERFDNAA